MPDRPLADPDDEWRRLARAWLLVLPDTACFTGLTAARLRGWWMPNLPEWLPLFVGLPLGSRGPRRSGLVVSRRVRPSTAADEWVDGLPVDTAVENLLRCARELGVLDLVIMLDRALDLGDVTRERMIEAGESGRPGAPRIRDAVRLCDPRSESPWESMLRVFHESIGVDVDVQPDLLDDRGRFVARGDLLVRGTRAVHEYDGAGHRDAATQMEDLRRDRRLVEASYVRRGFTASDLLRHPATTMSEIDRAIGRRTRMSRLGRWRDLLDSSSYSEIGRERLCNRWARRMGQREWSKPAG